jgi:hypothetical protein
MSGWENQVDKDTETLIDDDEELEDGADECVNEARYNWGDS